MLKSISRISGTLRFKGSWNAATNTPTLVSSVGTEGDVWIVSVAGNTDLNGTSNWGVDDWAVFLDGAWRRVEGGADGNFVNLTVTGVAEFADGSEAAPSITNIGDTDTGAYFPADNTVALTANAQEKLRVGATEVVVNDKGYDVDFRVEGDTDANLFVANAGSDNVGIGTSAPVAKLDVRGSAVFNEDGLDVDFRVEGDADANLVFVNAGTDKVGIGTATPPAKFSVLGNSSLDGAVTVNDTGAAVDFRVETDGDANAIFAQGSSNNVGFGTNTPSAKIDVSGDGRFANGVTINDLGADSDTRIEGDTDDHLVFVDASADQVGIGLSSMTAGYKLSVGGNLDVQGRGLFHTGAGTHYIDVGSDSTWAFSMSKNTSAGLLLGTRDATDVIITVNSELPNPISPNLFIDGSTGYVGISTNAPGSELDVKGTLRLSGSTSGYVGLQGAAAAGSTTYTLPAADGSSGQILTTDGAGNLSWSGVGSSAVFGPGSSTDEALVRWDGASGSLVQNSNALLTDAGRLTLSEGMWVNFLGLDADTIISTSGNAYALFVDGGTNNVGIGTSSPSYKLDVRGSTDTSYLNITSTADANGTTLRIGTDATAAFINATGGSSGTLQLRTYGTTRATIDSSGNLGLGVTPSAWNSLFKALDFSTTASLAGAAGSANLFNNAYWDGSQYVYKTNAEATRYLQASGEHIWYTAGSGTAGGGISFTQAMTLDASGNLGIGTTTPPYKLVISNAGQQGLEIDPLGIASQPFLQAYNRATSAYLQLSYVALQHVWQTSGVEKARITSGGALCINSTSTTYSEKLKVDGGIGGYAVHTVKNDTGSQGHFVFSNPNGAVGSIFTNGTSTSYNTSSDRRLKENIAPADDAGAVIDAIEIVKHDWKVGGHTRYGVIAQDLHEVAPEAVKMGDDGEEVTDTWGVDYSKLVPMLVKEIQSLRARVAALEGAN